MSAATVRCTLNGRAVMLGDADNLLDVLRNEHGLRSVRVGCGQEQCGACHVLLDGHSVPSCKLPLWAVENKQVVTLELAGFDRSQGSSTHGLSGGSTHGLAQSSGDASPLSLPGDEAVASSVESPIATVLRALQDAFVAEQAAQCGYCTSGILMSAAALLLATPMPTEVQIRAALERHLCRCGAHLRILRAVARAARALGRVDAA